MYGSSIPLLNGTMVLTAHACQRMAQRNMSREQTAFVLKYGRRFHRAGVVLVHLRRKDIPSELMANDVFARLEGATVVVNRESSSIITVWRNRDKGLRHIRRKLRYGY